jgi:hypothetical protein
VNRRHPRSFRGLHALIEHPPGRDRTVLKNQLEFLGLRVTVHDSAAPSPSQSVDILFFDADGGQATESGGVHRELDLPVVALIGSEAPTRLQAMLARQPVRLFDEAHPLNGNLCVACHCDASVRHPSSNAP